MAVSATVSPGKIFSTDEVITISELNKLGTPTVDISGAVGSLSISPNSINNSHVQSAAAIQLDKLASGSSAQLVVANSSGVPTYVALSGDATISNAGVLALAADSVVTVDILDLNVTTGKLADDAVTAAKLVDMVGLTPAEYTSATVTVDQQGRITAASSGSVPSGYSSTVISTTGSSTWTKPTGATLIRVVAVGGGAGSGVYSAGDGGAVLDWIDVSSVSSVAVTIGGGGSAGSGSWGSDGGNTLFGDYLTANGGSGASNGTVSGSQDSAEIFSGLASTIGNGGGGGSAQSAGFAGVVIVQVMG